ncbi:MAG: ferritin family protein [Anaerolineae bacterium]|nr:ferritin family protein [Anaerolineae bacterium]
MDIRKIYEYALEREREGKKFFQENAGRFSHAAVSGAFKKLADEEQVHIDFILNLIAQLDMGDKIVQVGPAWEGEGFFSQRAETEMLDQVVIESMVPDLSVLRMAYLIERDFAEFYEMAADRVQDEVARLTLQTLARWERGHERLFQNLHDKAFELYAGMPWGG